MFRQAISVQDLFRPSFFKYLPFKSLGTECLGSKNSEGNFLFLEDSNEQDTYLSFLNSLSLESPAESCHPDAVKYVKNFNKHKEELIIKLFTMFNNEAFDNVLPRDLLIVWNPRLTKTAGVCVQRKIRINNTEEQRLSKIELSSKVIDSPGMLCNS